MSDLPGRHRPLPATSSATASGIPLQPNVDPASGSPATGPGDDAEELAATLARLRARFDQSGHPQAVLDLDGRFTAVNDAFCSLVHRTRPALLGALAADVAQPVESAARDRWLQGLRTGELPHPTIEAVVLRGDRTRLPVLIDLGIVSDASGPREVTLFARDPTALRETQGRLASQVAFFQGINARSSDMTLVIDAQARITFVSASVTEALGYLPEHGIGRRLSEFLGRDHLETSKAVGRQLLADPSASVRRMVQVRAADGALRWFDAVSTNCLDDLAINGVVTNLRDVTAEIEAQRALVASEARFRAIAETAQEGIVALAPDGTVTFANDTLAHLLGVPVRDLKGTNLSVHLGPWHDDVGAGSPDAGSAMGGRSGSHRREIAYTRPDGARRILQVVASPLTHDDGTPMGSLRMVSDVTARREAEAELRHRALHDALTGLPNRALLVDRLTMAAARQQRDGGTGLAVLFLDLDHFKLVNDSRGHDAGDRLLVDVADRLRQAVRESDTVARLGGDEFAVVCEDAGRADATVVAARIQEAIAAPFDLGGDHVYISASIGIAFTPPYDVSDLLRLADAAMYDAKAEGRSRVSLFEASGSGGSQRRLAITGALREALGDHSLTLGYQAIVDLSSGRPVGLEALLRWQHAQLRPVQPTEVVDAADGSGLSFALDTAVIRAAAADLVRLRSGGDVPRDTYVSVNISPRSTQRRGLDDVVRETLERTGLPAACLRLEITEHAIMGHAERAAAALSRVAALGVAISIDDFGTGYNSLAHLQSLPLHELKIDRSFVTGITGRADSLAIARSIVSLGRALGLRTVAEGIETVEQLDAVRELGCRAGQGYLWGPAVPASEVASAWPRWRSVHRGTELSDAEPAGT